MTTEIVRGESIDDYHAHPAVSSSGLHDFVTRGPRFFAARYVTNRRREPNQTEAMLFGQAFEDMLQRPREWSSLYAVKPAGMKFSTKEGKAWKESCKLPVLAEEDVEKMREMVESIEENETALALMRASEQQVTLRSDSWSPIPGLQSRPDYFSSDGCLESGFQPFTLDLKSTIILNKLTSGRGVIQHGYHRQAAIARELMPTSLSRHFLLAVEKCTPHRCQVIEVGCDWLDAGWRWCEAALARLAKCYETGEWPRVEQEMVSLPDCPPWAAEVDDESETA